MEKQGLLSLEVEKENFLKDFGQNYGYPNAPKTIDELRASEFKRLDDAVYLDHAGATLYSELQMEAVFKELTMTVYGNPHSQSDASLATSEIVGKARQLVLTFFNASPMEYKCIFTAGATSALKLVGEAFPWSNQSSFMYTIENHNSVLGIREYALSKGATAFAVDIEEASLNCGSTKLEHSVEVSPYHFQRRTEYGTSEKDSTGDAYNLFAFPSECNFSGLKFNPNLVKVIKEDSDRIMGGSSYHKGHWMVLIDAAKGCATEQLNLSKYKADFVVISFYKLFGYPTGLGALIMRNEAAKLLKKTYFGGGTVAASIADVDFIKRREGVEESFEDGTISFLNVASIHHGFRILNTLTMSAISQHTTSLASYTRKMLSALKHVNGTDVCTIYGINNSKCKGPTISFNLKRLDGSWYGYREVEKLASLSGIQLRTGCFCNPGACAKYLGLSHTDLLSNIEAGHICWDDNDILQGKPTGAVRISFGYMSTFNDALKFVNFISSSFVSLPSENLHIFRTSSTTQNGGVKKATPRHFLSSITIYPIKSCEGFQVKSWPLSSTGLLHDREWLLNSPSGEILTQKKVPNMFHIRALIDLNLGKLFVESPHCKKRLQIELTSDPFVSAIKEIYLHPHRYEVQSYGDEVDMWFSEAVGHPCTLLRSSGLGGYLYSNKTRNRRMCRDAEARLNFVNEGQFLLITEESVSDLNSRLYSVGACRDSHGLPLQVNPMRFRPNLVISGVEPYAEDRWNGLQIGNKSFKSLGGCNRCQMINLNPQPGGVQRLNEPLATLAVYRRHKGKIFFGILLRCEETKKVWPDKDSWIQVGQEVSPVVD